ncbi:MAG: hypothetical protein M1829_000186 [Trizodia sp. TS-e1964]|nr:MAG: hypothetical protein M1829_000186 [Trizodia sp. TS-e1964]
MQKTEIYINVYDLLPPGRLSRALWAMGSSLLHSGVVINDREYAYGGHDKQDITGVYSTAPRTEPPGGTFKCGILHGFTIRTEQEIAVIASEAFLGTSYNLLSNNCNHFTSYLCAALTSRAAPRWLNRAACIGMALPCVVPRDWIAPPDYDDVHGELVDEELEDERARMIYTDSDRKPTRFGSDHHRSLNPGKDWNSENERQNRDNGKGKAAIKDSAGRILPPSERASVLG